MFFLSSIKIQRMANSTYLSLLFTISMISISHALSPTPSPKSNPKLYEIVCEGVAMFGEEERCLKLLEPNSQITSAKDFFTLSKVYLEMSIEKATKGQDYLKSLMNKYASSQALEMCATKYYGDLIAGFQRAIRELPKEPDGASWEIHAVGDDPHLCDLQLAQENIVHDPSITALNSDMSFLCLIAGEAIDHI
ncbi:hypothetical protein KIW84_031517 [Lathyrus oleraceus]|uniref:Pectinesterase inhibitor domain-containing protein n=1 Tax=Pisum sativum TaxID=3888 RepID=A0A9D4XSH1_PEA|nr:hypothetical protein KIW84_031517 [Pisum sativum]